jgi:glycosyltransferase involved in cell wall biosynthesis
MPDASTAPIDPRRCVVIPSFNSGPLLERTAREVLAVWRPVIVVDDGSNDGSAEPVIRLAQTEPGLHVLTQPRNTGKGAAVLAAFSYAVDRGFTHAAVFDADGQHYAAEVAKFMKISAANPLALVMGNPEFGKDAPASHVVGHGIANFFARLETLRPDLGDSLFGFRVYPMLAAIKALRRIRGGRRFDFDTQAAVRMAWLGVPTVNFPTSVCYPGKDRVRHFRYLRDNLLLIRVHLGLLVRAVLLWPKLLWRRSAGTAPFDATLYRG